MFLNFFRYLIKHEIRCLSISQWVLIDFVQSGHSAGKLPGFDKVGASEAPGNIASGSIGKSAPTSELAVSICGSDCVSGVMVGVADIFEVQQAWIVHVE